MFKKILNDVKEGYTCEYTTCELIEESQQLLIRAAEAKNFEEMKAHFKLIVDNEQQRTILDMKMARKSRMLRLGGRMGLIGYYLEHGYL
jgi:ferric iron reductase protein FhuF